jgi:hypothetical protein
VVSRRYSPAGSHPYLAFPLLAEESGGVGAPTWASSPPQPEPFPANEPEYPLRPRARGAAQRGRSGPRRPTRPAQRAASRCLDSEVPFHSHPARRQVASGKSKDAANPLSGEPLPIETIIEEGFRVARPLNEASGGSRRAWGKTVGASREAVKSGGRSPPSEWWVSPRSGVWEGVGETAEDSRVAATTRASPNADSINRHTGVKSSPDMFLS